MTHAPRARPAAGLSALLLLACAAVATATPLASKVVTQVAGLAARAEALASNKSGLVTAPNLVEAAQIAFPSPKLPFEALKKGVGFKCGAEVGMCPMGHCCSQGGLCELTPTACDGTCQLHYSGPGSPCSANLPPPLASVVWAGDEKLGLGPKVTGALPPVPPGAVCGEYVGACPAAQCCSQFGFCVEDASYFCSTAACVLAASPASPSCMAAWAARTPITRKLKLVASWGRAAPDGVEREVILLNGKFPGPTVRGTVRDRVQIEFVNLLNEPASIHWHGQRQVATSIMDGVVSVTQRPVGGADGATNASTTPPAFLYDFVLREGGAYWYHSHASTQYADGLRGALFVDDPAFTLDSAGSPGSQQPTLLFLTDWYHQLAAPLTASYVSGDNPDGVEPVPDNALANGIGQHYCGDGCEVAVLAAAPPGDGGGKRGAPTGAPLCSAPTDLVLVNGAAFAPFYVSLFSTGPHVRAFITALDGVPTAPEEVTGSPVFVDAGQRVQLSLCRGGGDAAAAARSPVFVLSEMADASFDYDAPFNSTVAVLDFSGRRGGLAGVAHAVEEVQAERVASGLPWKAGASRVSVASLLAVPGLVPPEVEAALGAVPKPRPGSPALGDAPPAAKAAAAAPPRKAGPVGAVAAAKTSSHVHDREELNPARVAAREAMRGGASFRPRTAPGQPPPPQAAAAVADGASSSSPPYLPTLSPLSPPGPPQKTLQFYVVSNPNAANQSFFYVNGISLQPPEYGPSLLERIYGNPEGQGYANAVPAPLNATMPAASAVGWNVIDNDLGTVVDLLFVNGDSGEHPIHTHGHWVFVMETGYGTPDSPLRDDPDSPFAPATAAPPTPTTTKDAPLPAPLLARDTVTLPAGGFLRLRYIVDNPSTWIVHCHIDWHLYVGLGFVMRDGI